MSEYDIVIIGAGSVGVPTALACMHEGLKTLVIERNSSVSQGDNKHAIGGIRAAHSQKGKIWVGQRSIDIFSSWEKKYGDDIEWVQGGYTFVAYSEEHEQLLKDTVNLQKKYGLNINFISSDKMEELIPGINPQDLRGGTYSPEDGNASPLLALNAFYRKAKENGVEFQFKEKVNKILSNNGKITGLMTDKGSYNASKIVNATGDYAKEIGKTIGLNIPVIPDSHEAGITEPVKTFFKPMIVDIRPVIDLNWGNSKNYYFYQNKRGQVVFCLTPDPPIIGTNRNETSSFLPQVAKRMVNLLPRLKHLKIRRTWRGLYPMTPDGSPIVGKTKEIEGYINAVGMCGQGYMLGPGIGEVVARLAAEKSTTRDMEILKEFSLYRLFKSVEKLK